MKVVDVAERDIDDGAEAAELVNVDAASVTEANGETVDDADREAFACNPDAVEDIEPDDAVAVADKPDACLDGADATDSAPKSFQGSFALDNSF